MYLVGRNEAQHYEQVPGFPPETLPTNQPWFGRSRSEVPHGHVLWAVIRVCVGGVGLGPLNIEHILCECRGILGELMYVYM